MTQAIHRTPPASASLAAGALTGIDLLGRCLALATLLFAGPLGAAAVPALAVFCLMSAFGTVVSLPPRGSGTLALATVQLAPVAVLSPAIAALAEGAAQGAMPPGDALVTGMAILGMGTLACGAAMALFAAFDLGRMVRLMPYPVTAGFMAASGALLVIAGARLALGTALAVAGIGATVVATTAVAQDGKVVNVYNWAEYTAPDTSPASRRKPAFASATTCMTPTIRCRPSC
jgi:SulP family sulfate permease